MDDAPTILGPRGAARAPEDARGEKWATDGTREARWVGQSVLHVRGACVDEGATCAGPTASEDGTFFLNAAATGGEVTVSWRPVDETLRVLRITIAGLEVEGESPLRLRFDGLVAGEHAIHVRPAESVLGVHDQLVDWVASFHVTSPFETLETRGRSEFRTVSGCALGQCGELGRHRSDPLVVPWPARGTLHVSWDPTLGPLRIDIPGTGLTAEGEPPLLLDVGGMLEGEWQVQVEPAVASLPMSEVSASWLAKLSRAP